MFLIKTFIHLFIKIQFFIQVTHCFGNSGLLSDLVETNFNSLNISAFCKDDLNLLSNGFKNREIWSTKLLDASGRIESGFIWGNNFWLGSRRACERIRYPIDVVLSNAVPKIHRKDLVDITAPMPVNYRMIWAKHYSPLQVDIHTLEKTVIHMGLCMPTSCTDADTILLTANLFENPSFSGQIFFNGTTTEILLSKILELNDNYFEQPIVLLFISILLIQIILVVIGSNFQFIKNKLLYLLCDDGHGDTCCSQNNGNNNNSINGNNNNNNNNLENGKKDQLKKPGFFDKFIMSFSLERNSKIITTSSLGNDSIESIHGLRALGMCWIIVGHTFFYAPGTIDNLQMILTYAENWYLQPIFAVAMAVDTYFVIGGLVLSYLYFQCEKKRTKKENDFIKFFKSIISRLMRLTPPYMVAMIFTATISYYLRDTSQFWMIEKNDVTCPQYWWRNLLYINNFYPMSDMCMSWSWYLATDFQCFVITSMLLIIFTRSEKIGFILFGIILFASSAFSGYLGYTLSYALSLDIQYYTVDYLYTPVWSRIGAYFTGVFAGWYLSVNDRKLNMKKKYLILCWTLGPLLNLIMIFGSTSKDISPIAAAFYTSLGKITWALGIVWVIVACSTGNGGPINKILSSQILLPFSRMTYTAYLINPICIMFIVMTTEVAVHLDFTTLLVMCCGFTIIVFIMSYIFMLLFENPFIRITKLLQGK